MITIRFTEFARYDPFTDSEIVQLMGITNVGTYHTEVPVEAPQPLRLRRKEFKDQVLALIDAGRPPCEVDLKSTRGEYLG